MNMRVNRNSNVRPDRKEYRNLTGTRDWYLVIGPRGKQIPVRQIVLNGREPVAGPYQTKDQALCERTDRVW